MLSSHLVRPAGGETVSLVGSLLLILGPAASADGVYQNHYDYQWRINRLSAPYQTQTRWLVCAQSHGGTVTSRERSRWPTR